MTQTGPLPSVDVTEADRRLREDPGHPVLLDVREMNEFVEVRAPGVLLLPTSALAARIGEVPTDRPILVVCRTGVRSAAVTGFLIRSGRSDVFNVTGGMEAREHAGLPVRRGPTDPGEGDLTGG